MFTLFKKTYDNNTVLKIFRVVTKEQASEFEIQQLIAEVLQSLKDFFDTEPTNYYITGPYPNEGWKTKKGFLKAVERKHFKNICHLIFSTDSYSFSFENWSLNDIKPKEKDYQAIEFSIDEKQCDYDKMELLYKNIAAVFPPDYAFIFKLPKNYMPSTESKIKNSFFSFSVVKNPKEVIWRKHIDNVDKGILKDVYSINFVNDAIINSDNFQREIISKSVGSIKSSHNHLYKWTLNSEEIQEARKKLFGTALLIEELPA